MFNCSHEQAGPVTHALLWGRCLQSTIWPLPHSLLPYPTTELKRKSRSTLKEEYFTQSNLSVAPESSHLLYESWGVIRAPSCIFHHAGSCCWNSCVNGNSRRHDLNKLGLEFLHTAFIPLPSKGSYWKNKYLLHNLLKGSYCMKRQIIILLPYGWGQRGISFLTAIQSCLLAVVFPWLSAAFVQPGWERQVFSSRAR